MPRVLGIAHQRARILLRKTRSKILCSPKGSHFAPQNKEDYEMEKSCANTVRVRYRKARRSAQTAERNRAVSGNGS